MIKENFYFKILKCTQMEQNFRCGSFVLIVDFYYLLHGEIQINIYVSKTFVIGDDIQAFVLGVLNIFSPSYCKI